MWWFFIPRHRLTPSHFHVFSLKVFSGKTYSGQKVWANALCLLCPQHRAEKKRKKKTPQRPKTQSPTDKTNSADTLHLLTISLVLCSSVSPGGGSWWGCCHHGDNCSQPASINRPQPGILGVVGSDSNNLIRIKSDRVKTAAQNHLPRLGDGSWWRSDVSIRQKTSAGWGPNVSDHTFDILKREETSSVLRPAAWWVNSKCRH